MLLNISAGRGSKIRHAIIGLSLAMLFTFRLSAVTITYNFEETLEGVPPSGPTPWLTAVVSDSGAGGVQISLSAPGLTGNEYVNQWFFNLNPAMDPTKLVFTETASTGAFTLPTVATGADAFKPAYDGKYDILFGFSGSGDNSAKFTGGDSITFSITGIAGLSANDFLFENTPAAGHGALYAAAYIQTVGEAVIIDRVDSSVPDGGSTVILLGLSLLGIEVSRRKLVLRRPKA
jgi:hypothetical protein